MTEEIKEEIKKPEGGPRKFRVVVAEQIYYHVDIEAADSGQARAAALKTVEASGREMYIRELDREATAVFCDPPNFGEPIERVTESTV